MCECRSATWRDSHRSCWRVRPCRLEELQSLQTDAVALWSSLERLETSFKTAGGLTVQPLRRLQESFIRMYSRTMGGVIEYVCIYVYLLTYWELLEYMKNSIPSIAFYEMRWGRFYWFKFVLVNMMMRFGFAVKLKRTSTSGKHYLYSKREYCQPVIMHIIAMSHYHYRFIHIWSIFCNFVSNQGVFYCHDMYISMWVFLFVILCCIPFFLKKKKQ